MATPGSMSRAQSSLITLPQHGLVLAIFILFHFLHCACHFFPIILLVIPSLSSVSPSWDKKLQWSSDLVWSLPPAWTNSAQHLLLNVIYYMNENETVFLGLGEPGSLTLAAWCLVERKTWKKKKQWKGLWKQEMRTLRFGVVVQEIWGRRVSKRDNAGIWGKDSHEQMHNVSKVASSFMRLEEHKVIKRSRKEMLSCQPLLKIVSKFSFI